MNKDFDFPTIYRVDRIEQFEQTSISFKVPYHERFQEGEFRKRVQFMYTGELIVQVYWFFTTSRSRSITNSKDCKENE